MDQLKVMLWGEELGRLVWDPKIRNTYFTFNPKIKERPDVAPLLIPRGKSNFNLPVFGDDRRIYQKLPPFIADSLPDAWGNKLFDKWISENKIPKNRITPLYKLMFIGKRGMGALEFKPADDSLNYKGKIDVRNLYQLSLNLFEGRRESSVSVSEVNMETLIAVGTSAGGRQMKAIVALNNETGEIRSGQVENPEGFEYYIIKFEDKEIPTTEIELAYHEMVLDSGIIMEKCFPFQVDGVSHFMTKRFDRNASDKIFTQTLAAINPEAASYEDLFETSRRLNLSEPEIAELFRRLVFNVIFNNTDDHNKNFSFLLEENGKWKLAPAYDVTFIFNRNATAGDNERIFSLHGKTKEITRRDLIEFAKENNIKKAEKIINKIVDVAKSFPEYSNKYNIPERFSNIIHATIHRNLYESGFIGVHQVKNIFDNIVIESLKLNYKGIYELRVSVQGKTIRRFISPDDEYFMTVQKLDGRLLTETETKSLIEKLFASR